MSFSGKKLLLIGMFLLLLIGIPITLYIVQQQTENRSQAQKATILSYSPDSTPSSPITKKVGDEFTVDLMVNPGSNLVSFISFEITYSPEFLQVASANGFLPNSSAFPTTLEGPTVTPGKITGTLSVGAEPTRAIQVPTKAGTITFKALKATGAGPIQVTYSQPQTKVLSIGSNDQFSEDVLASANPAYIVITGAGPSGTPTPTLTGSPQPTGEAPTPTEDPGLGSGTIVPVCTNFTASPGISGDAPLTVQFVTEGEDTDGTIEKVTYNFGDGNVADVTDAEGVGTATVSAQVEHVYNDPGTFQATTVLTDDSGGVSAPAGCSQTITVLAPTTAASATPTIPPTGPGDTILGIGAIVAVVTILGGFIFFAL